MAIDVIKIDKRNETFNNVYTQFRVKCLQADGKPFLIVEDNYTEDAIADIRITQMNNGWLIVTPVRNSIAEKRIDKIIQILQNE